MFMIVIIIVVVIVINEKHKTDKFYKIRNENDTQKKFHSYWSADEFFSAVI